MAKTQVKKKTKKNIKKRFYEVKLPMTSLPVHLYGADPEDFEGKVVKVDMSKNLRGRSMEIKYKLEVKDGNITGKPFMTQVAQSHVRRMVRRGTDYVEDSFSTGCRDLMVRVKPFLITRRRVSRAVRRALRDSTKKYLVAHFKTRTAEEIISELLANKIQRSLVAKLKKIYPLAFCDIRAFKIEGEKEESDEPEMDEEETSEENVEEHSKKE